MKVFQINTVCGSGSTGRIAVDIAHILEQAGHQSCIAYGRSRAPQGLDTYKIDQPWETYLHVALSRITDKQGLYSSAATRRLLEKIKAYQPDVIQLHNIHGYYLNYRLLFQFLAEYDKPVVWTLHDCWPFTGHCAYFDFVQCNKWRTECHACPQKKTYPTSYVLDNSRANYELKKQLFTSVRKMQIVTPSHWLAKLVKQSFLAKYDVHVIPNGIDTNVFKPTKSDFRQLYHLEDKKIILGVASPWTPRKGLADFIKLSTMLDDSWQIVVVGVDKKQIKQLPANMVGLQRTENARELAGLYATADIFFNPTYEDNYPTTNLEAIACGTPVITYDTGGSPESLDVETGRVVEKRNVKAVTSAVDQCMKLDVNAKNKQKLLDKHILFQKYLGLYSNFL